jgi:AcrR family transcriptional regulator
MGDRRGQIVDAAYALLASDGLEGLTIRSVLARTGLSRRAFYERFATKDDLVLAVFQQTLIDAASQFANQIAAIDSPIERLRHIVTGIVMGHIIADENAEWQNNRRAAALSREHLRLAEARPAELQQAIAPLVDLIRAQLNDGMRAGAVRISNAEQMAMMVYNLVSTTVHGQVISEEQSTALLADRVSLADDIWQFCHRAIAA